METFPGLLAHHAATRGDQPAMRLKRHGIWRTLTWGEFDQEVRALAAALAASGVQRGHHVALLGGNRPRLYAAMCAAQWLGAVALPLFDDAAAGEIETPLRNAEVGCVFAEDQEQVDKLLRLLPSCPALRRIVFDQERGMRRYRQPQLVSYAELLQQGRDGLAARREWLQAELERGRGSDVASLLYTSGTTGPAKGVVLSHAALIDRARAIAGTEGMSPADVTLAYLPPAWIGQHVFGYALPMLLGCCVCCPESSDTMQADMREVGPTFILTTASVLQTLATQVFMRIEETGGLKRWLYGRSMATAQRVGARVLAGEPVALVERLRYGVGSVTTYGPLRDVLGLSRVRVGYAAGDAIDPDLLLYFRSLGINLKQLYGTTETGFFVALQRNDEVKADTVGRAAEGVELRVTSEREVLVRSPGLFKEYYRDPETTRSALSSDGWYRTGDAGYVGDDGQLRIIDRLVNVGALNDGALHAPRALESRLKSFPYIREAVAFGDGRDRVCVLIDIDEAAVGRWAGRRHLAYTGRSDLASLAEVRALIADCIAQVNARLQSDPQQTRSQVHRFAILHEELDAAGGLLTRTGKLRRGLVAERYRTLVDAMYDGSARARLEPQARSSDADAVVVIIGEANTFGADRVA